jgi:exopolysaccharide biosynthesis polyprenyl glycosylphosphotransferase
MSSLSAPPESAAQHSVDAAPALDTAALGEAVALRRSRTSVPKRRGWLVRRMLVVADVVGLTVAFAVAQSLTMHPDAGDWARSTELLFFVVMLPVWVVLADLHGLYKRDEERTDHSTADDLVGVFQLVTLGSWVFFVVAWLTGFASPPIGRIILFWALAITSVTLARATARAFSRRRLTYLQNTVIVGAGTIGQQIAHKVLHHREYGINLVGFVDASPRERRQGLSGVPLLGRPEQLRAIIKRFGVERVVIAFSSEPEESTLALVRSIKDLDVQVDIVPRLFEILTPAAPVFTVEGVPLVGLPPLRLSRRARVLKRALDLVASAVALVLLAPFFALIGLLIKLETPGPVFFRQLRVGTKGQVFRIYKFRTMGVDADERKAEFAHLNRHAQAGGDSRMFKIDHDPRVTRLGRFLRKYSLDELPQLVNVVQGEMSLVGPRPLIAEEAQYVSEWGRKRLDLKPGITGLWQVLGRSAIPFEEMVRLDYLYVTTWSLWNDCLLLLRTLAVVARGAHD